MRHLQIAKEVGDKAGEGRAYGSLGDACDSLGNFHLQITKEVGEKAEEGKSYGNFCNAYQSFCDFHESNLKLSWQNQRINY